MPDQTSNQTSNQTDAEPLLDVRNLSVKFRTRQGQVTAVDNLSFSIAPGQVLGVVGESGSGKSVTCLAVLRLLTDPGVIIEGEVLFRGRDLLKLPDKELRSVRGREIAMIFQDPMTALTPVYTAGWHIAEQIRAHEDISKKAARARAIQLLDEVGIPNPDQRVDSYPHQFSGGMRQRVVIAMALACNPALLIADEPTTALDVTIQAQILDLMQRLRRDHGSSILLITHDMGVVSQIADDVLVMYGGRVSEFGSRREVFHHPAHPYTWGLLSSIPRTDRARTRRLAAIPGQPISPLNLPPGCRFAPRCHFAHDTCEQSPPLVWRAPRHADACWLPVEDRPELRRQSDAAADAART
jgi:peptide/nickel transport system ATP-binding protein